MIYLIIFSMFSLIHPPILDWFIIILLLLPDDIFPFFVLSCNSNHEDVSKNNCLQVAMLVRFSNQKHEILKEMKWTFWCVRLAAVFMRQITRELSIPSIASVKY